MNKSFIVIIVIAVITGGIIGYFSKVDVIALKEQIDLKSGSTDINWIIESRSYCDTSGGSCENYSDSSSSSWGGSSGGGGGK